VNTVTVEREGMVEQTVTSDHTGCRVVTSGSRVDVYLGINLPPDFPEERRLGVIRYARAAVMAIENKIGRDE
jgi:hypothetical protein